MSFHHPDDFFARNLAASLELNPFMLDRGRQLAEEAGVGDLVEGTEADFNQWIPKATCEAVMANQSLHHVMALEHVFAAVHAALEPQDRFVVADMIGRIEARDEAEIRAGRIKPTHRFAVMPTGMEGTVRCLDHLTPRFCLRFPD